jgi:tRNA-dihydrouridine synthase
MAMCLVAIRASSWLQESGVDGIMIGRGIFQNIHVFEKKQQAHAADELIDILVYHLELTRKPGTI